MTVSDGTAAAAPRHGRIGRRRQVDADRPAPLRRQAAARGPARRPARERQRRGARPGLDHRRPARRARAGHHDRRRLPVLHDREALVHHRRHPRPRALHAQHGHRRLDRAPGGHPDRRPQRDRRAVAPPRRALGAARHPPPRGRGEQDGPRRLGRGALPRDRARLRRAGAADRRRRTRAPSRSRRSRATTSSSAGGRTGTTGRRCSSISSRSTWQATAAPVRCASRSSGCCGPRTVRTARAATRARWRAGRCGPARRWCRFRAARAPRSPPWRTFDGPLEAAMPPDSISVQLEHDVDVGRGDLLCGVDAPPPTGSVLEATVCWMAERPLRRGDKLALKHTTRTLRAAVASLDALLDIATLEDGPRARGARAQRHRPGDAQDERADGRRPLRRQPHHGRLHPRRRADQRHRRRRHGAHAARRGAAPGEVARRRLALQRPGARRTAGTISRRAARRSG